MVTECELDPSNSGLQLHQVFTSAVDLSCVQVLCTASLGEEPEPCHYLELAPFTATPLRDWA